jgi:hypothetical protein
MRMKKIMIISETPQTTDTRIGANGPANENDFSLLV